MSKSVKNTDMLIAKILEAPILIGLFALVHLKVSGGPVVLFVCYAAVFWIVEWVTLRAVKWVESRKR
jgi:hypothetical protein